jgi:hypothetical protein
VELFKKISEQDSENGRKRLQPRHCARVYIDTADAERTIQELGV